MYTIYPEFYDNFICKAGNCQHSCCLGWEIDIDAVTAEKYLAIDGAIGANIRRHMSSRKLEGTDCNADAIQYSEEPVNTDDEYREYFFAMTENNRCPFLQDDGLCELILAKGEDILCDICAMHPRFFTYLGDAELAGVGLSCEHSVELLLQQNRPLLFYMELTNPGDAAGECNVVDKANAETAGQKYMDAAVAEGAEYKELAVPEGPGYMDFQGVLEYMGIELPAQWLHFQHFHLEDFANAKNHLHHILNIMKETEPIDAEWTRLLDCLSASLNSNNGKGEKQYCQDSYAQLEYDKLYQYILYRQLENLNIYPMEKLVEFAQLNVAFIWLSAQYTGDLAEAARQWSAQIEYDLDNVELIYEKINF